jgi:hypothetical protein
MLVMAGHFVRAAVCIGAAVFAYNRLQEGADEFYLYADSSAVRSLRWRSSSPVSGAKTTERGCRKSPSLPGYTQDMSNSSFQNERRVGW